MIQADKELVQKPSNKNKFKNWNDAIIFKIQWSFNFLKNFVQKHFV